MSFSILILNWKLNGTFGARIWFDWSEECLATEKISWKNKQKFIFQVLLKIEIGI